MNGFIQAIYRALPLPLFSPGTKTVTRFLPKELNYFRVISG